MISQAPSRQELSEWPDTTIAGLYRVMVSTLEMADFMKREAREADMDLAELLDEDRERETNPLVDQLLAQAYLVYTQQFLKLRNEAVKRLAESR